MHYGHSYEDGHHQFAWELVTAGHGTVERIGFKYGKMKGLKISPPRSVARIDHTSFLCAKRSFRILLPVPYPTPFALCPILLRVPSTRPPHTELASVVHLPFRASPPVRATCHSSSNPIRRARCGTCVPFPSVCGTAWKRGVYEIPVKTLLSGFSGRLRRVPAMFRACSNVQTFPSR